MVLKRGHKWGWTIMGILLISFIAFVVWAHHIAVQAKSMAGESRAASYTKAALKTHNPSRIQEAIRLHPNDADAHWGLGDYYLITNDRQAAVTEYEQVVRLQPQNHEAGNMLAHMLLSIGRRQESIALYQKLAQYDDPDSRNAQHMLKRIYSPEGR